MIFVVWNIGSEDRGIINSMRHKTIILIIKMLSVKSQNIRVFFVGFLEK